jgi:SEC-C motif
MCCGAAARLVPLPRIVLGMMTMKDPCPCGSGRKHQICCSENAKRKEQESCAKFIATVVGKNRELRDNLYGGGWSNHWASWVGRGLLLFDDGKFDDGMREWTTGLHVARREATPTSVDVASVIEAVLDSYLGVVREGQGLISPSSGPDQANAARLWNLAHAVERATKRKGAQRGLIGYYGMGAYCWLLGGSDFGFDPNGAPRDASVKDLMSELEMSRTVASQALKGLFYARLLTETAPRITLRVFTCSLKRDKELSAEARQQIIRLCERAASGRVRPTA